VYLGDEEPAHFLHGWYGGGAPEWATRYADTYRDEKGADFDWDKRECRDWIIGKGRALWDDLYRIIKSVDPDLKVMPFLYVPGDLSGWGMWDPKEIKADGWVYQWYYHDAHQTVKVKLAQPVGGTGEVLARETWFNASVNKIVAAGVLRDEIYVQIWAYRPQDDPVDQTEQVRLAGIRNIWVFYTCAWLPPKPVAMPALRDGAFRLTTAGEEPALSQETSDAFLAVGVGLAQSFVAGEKTLTSVDLRLQAKSGVPHTLKLLPEDAGRPAKEPLAAAPVAVPAGFDDWLRCPLAAELQVGKRYYLALTPDELPADAQRGPRSEADASGPLLWAASTSDPYPGGELIHREVYEGYFDDWRLYSSEAAGTWIGDWGRSYNERMVWESYIRDMRRLGR